MAIRNAIAVILYGVSVVILSCNKDENQATGRYYAKVSEKLESYFFEKGSYWIYQNTSTRQIDSTFVIDHTKDKYAVDPGAPGIGSRGDREYFEISYGSSFRKGFKELLLADMISKSKMMGGYLFFGSRRIGDERINAKLTHIHDSIIVGNKMYYDVIEMSIKKDAYVNVDMNLFYKDSVGVLRRLEYSLNDTNTFDLLRYQVDFFNRD